VPVNIRIINAQRRSLAMPLSPFPRKRGARDAFLSLTGEIPRKRKSSCALPSTNNSNVSVNAHLNRLAEGVANSSVFSKVSKSLFFPLSSGGARASNRGYDGRADRTSSAFLLPAARCRHLLSWPALSRNDEHSAFQLCVRIEYARANERTIERPTGCMNFGREPA